MVVEITNPQEKQTIARNILEALTDWFGIEESREEYITGSADWTFLAAKEAEKYVESLPGVCTVFNNDGNVVVSLIGFHRNGGRR